MVECRIEITQTEYLEYANKSYKEIDDFIKSKLPIAIICGYGYYGGSLIIDEDKYYIRYRRGSSCD